MVPRTVLNIRMFDRYLFVWFLPQYLLVYLETVRVLRRFQEEPGSSSSSCCQCHSEECVGGGGSMT